MGKERVFSHLTRLIIIRFQDEPNYGRVEAWEDHGGSTGEQ